MPRAAHLDHLHDWRTGDAVPVLRIEPVIESEHSIIAIVHLQGHQQTPVDIHTMRAAEGWVFCASDWDRAWTAEEVRAGILNGWGDLPPWVDSSDGAAGVVKRSDKDGSPYIGWASEDVGRQKVRAWMEGVREEMRPHVNALAAAATANVKSLAADMGEPYSAANKMYWGTMGNLTKPNGGHLDSGAPELHALHQLAVSVPRLHRNQWSEAHMIVGDLFDELDGGEALGLGPLLDHEFDTPQDRAEAMRKAADFHRVPATYAPALGDVVTAMMLAAPDSYLHEGRALPQPWATTYAYCVACICERCKPDPWSPPEGQGRVPSMQGRP